MSTLRQTSIELFLRMLERRVDVFDQEHEVRLLIEGAFVKGKLSCERMHRQAVHDYLGITDAELIKPSQPRVRAGDEFEERMDKFYASVDEILCQTWNISVEELKHERTLPLKEKAPREADYIILHNAEIIPFVGGVRRIDWLELRYAAVLGMEGHSEQSADDEG